MHHLNSEDLPRDTEKDDTNNYNNKNNRLNFTIEETIDQQ